MDLLDDDLFLELDAVNAKGGGKFHPKIKPRPKKIASAPISSTLPNAKKKEPALVPSSSLETTQVAQPVNVVDDKLRNQVGSTDALEISETDEPAKDKEVSSSDGTRSSELFNSSSEVDVVKEVPISMPIGYESASDAMLDSSHNIHSSVLESTGQVESMEYDLDPFDDTLPVPVIKNARGKFQPRVNPKPGKDLSASVASDSYIAATFPNTPNDVAVCSTAATAPDGVACSAGENSDIFLGLEGLEDVIIQPSSGIDSHASELPVDEEPQTLVETSQLANTVMNDALADDVPLVKLGFRKRKISTVYDGKSTGQLRKCSGRQLIDESDEEARDNSGYDAEAHGNSGVVEAEDGNEESREGEKIKKKRAPRKKKHVAEGEKPVRKRKKASKETDQSADQPPKKFSHSTRRTRRQVDKALLETPEEELELTNMPMRDLIMFYLNKERIEDKERQSKKPSTNSSTQNDASCNEEEIFGTERNSGFADYHQGGDLTDMTAPHFNYQTYMDKTRSAKWTKQDDELFYKGVRQFGIDLSMIQLLFPDRTRRQIKLKLKKEERQYPLRLTEAVQNRATDHSQFESIIEQFKKAKAEEEEEFEGSESIGVTGDEDLEDVSPENNDEAMIAGDEEAEETADVESPMQFDEIEDDFGISDYKSEY